jgi:hypothetical protein
MALKDIFNFGKDQHEPLVLRRMIWSELSQALFTNEKGKVILPYTRLKIFVFVENETRKARFAAGLVEDRSLEKFLREKLKEEKCISSDKFRVTIEFVNERTSDFGKNIFYLAPETESATGNKPIAGLTILEGSTKKTRYKIEKKRTYIGRLDAVKDITGKVVRRNDVIFEDTGDKINTSVGRLHALIEFDDEKSVFTIQDTGSTTGTRIERESEFLDVLPYQKVNLRDGDILHLGRAAIRFQVE